MEMLVPSAVRPRFVLCASFFAWTVAQGVSDVLFHCLSSIWPPWRQFFVLFEPNAFQSLAPLGSVEDKNKCQNWEVFQKMKLSILKSLLNNFPFRLHPQSWSNHPLALLGRADKDKAQSEYKCLPYTYGIWRKWHIANPVWFFNPGIAQSWIAESNIRAQLVLWN